MFERFKEFDQILVTGPHRSGTTIVTHMMARDTGKVALDEVNINHKDIKLIPDILAKEPNCVLQCPQALPWIPLFSNDNTAIVFVYRKAKEIYQSIENSRTPEGKKISVPGFTPEQAYELWDKIKPLINNPFIVHYEEIKNHPMYVKKEKRTNWNHKSINDDLKRIARFDYGAK